jgi:hypothetical protein
MTTLGVVLTNDQEWDIVELCRNDLDEERVFLHMLRRNYREMNNRRVLLNQPDSTPAQGYSSPPTAPMKSPAKSSINSPPDSPMDCGQSPAQEIKSLENCGVTLTIEQEETLYACQNQLHEQAERLDMLRSNYMKEIDTTKLSTVVRRRLLF